MFLLAGSAFFYAWWDWRFLILLTGSVTLTYFIGLLIGKHEEDRRRKQLLVIGIVQSLGVLIFFKYYNFFIASFADLLRGLGFNPGIHTLNLILPLGISYYTFRILSYLIDVNNGKITPCRNYVDFFNYVSFFPCLLSGPIDRAKEMLPQLERKRVFDYAQVSDGLRQVAWGLLKKVVIADKCGSLVEQIVTVYSDMPGSSLALALFFFFIQLYADFSGYSDMAIGIARMLGFEPRMNFNYPFFARSIPEFWQRWHMSLTSWMTDYVFTPLTIQFRDYGKAGLILSILITFTIVGLWHGANWTYVIYGFVHGVYFIPQVVGKGLRRKASPLTLSFSNLVKMGLVFTIVMLTTALIVSNSVADAIKYYSILFSSSLFSNPPFFGKMTLFMSAVLVAIEWIQRDKVHPLQIDNIKPQYVRLAIYYLVVIAIVYLGASAENQFIYFKF